MLFSSDSEDDDKKTKNSGGDGSSKSSCLQKKQSAQKINDFSMKPIDKHNKHWNVRRRKKTKAPSKVKKNVKFKKEPQKSSVEVAEPQPEKLEESIDVPENSTNTILNDDDLDTCIPTYLPAKCSNFLLDNVSITDVSCDHLVVTVRECPTDDGFFKTKRSTYTNL